MYASKSITQNYTFKIPTNLESLRDALKNKDIMFRPIVRWITATWFRSNQTSVKSVVVTVIEAIKKHIKVVKMQAK